MSGDDNHTSQERINCIVQQNDEIRGRIVQQNDEIRERIVQQDNHLRARIVHQLTERPAPEWLHFPPENVSRQQVHDTLVNQPSLDWQMIPVASAASPAPAPAPVRFPRPHVDASQGLGFAPGMRRRRQSPPLARLESPQPPLMTVVNFDGARQQSDMSLAARFHGYMPEEKKQMQVRQVAAQTIFNQILQRMPNIETKIETYPTRKLDQVDKENTTECTICYEAWQSAQTVRTLPCLHYFHVVCIDRWLHQNMTCPQCRHRL